MAKRDFSHFELFRQLEQEIQRFTEDALRAALFHPPVDMYETAGALVVKIELAGVQPEKINVILSADNRTLTISGERAEAQDERRERVRCYQLEIYFGPFERHISLPGEFYFDRDRITANYRDGFLVISLPKQEKTTPEIRSIQVSSG
ncbi:MAG TPA: Hsp20/alpha crystallin family protein [Chthonomonadaceae bacterium]|nr:Hsp20/alpha crystallin family protein [Chthonomonadaceae bacterium]